MMSFVNYKVLFSFTTYNFAENSYIKTSNFASGPTKLKISYSVNVSSLFELSRLCNLIFVVTGIKPYIQRQQNSFKILIELSGYSLYKVLSKLYGLRLGAKSGFFRFSTFNNFNFISVNEPHVVFSVVSPYFDYHTSSFKLSFFSSINKNPSLSYILSWLFSQFK